ncbi:MAG: ABC transporter substrate-binding protein [Clostridia bacterium]|nr:ABC transporter substrate-binding protein [Clostridia bacterium]
MKKSLWKRVLAGVTCLTLAIAASGCTEQSKNKTSLEDDESQPYEIVWYYVGSANNADLEMVNQKVNEYVTEKINATVKMTPLDWSPFYTKMENIMSSGEKYDLRWVNDSLYQTAVFKGAFIDLDELLSTYAPQTRTLLGEDFINGAKINGKLYGVPANKDKAHSTSIFVRKDIAEKYNLDLTQVHNWGDMYPLYDVIRDNEPSMRVYGMGNSASPWDITDKKDDLGGNGLVGFIEGSDKVQNLFETDLYRECITTAREMYQAGYIYKDVAVNDSTSDMRKQGKVFAYARSSNPGVLAELNASYGYEWVEISLSDPVYNASDCQGSMMAIPVSCKNPIRVMKFIELLNTDKYLNNLINFGIEGVHYDKVGENRIALKKDSGYKTNSMQWVFGNTFINYLYEGEADDKYEKLAEFNEEAKASPYLGFVPNLESVKIQVSSCNNVVNEYGEVLEFGAADIDEVLPAFQQKLKQAGIDEIVAEVQKQYDEWKANNQ